ncbi:hypothetical protein C440_14079 [Haloferax mucosum ATCC BAA-1512]|uniref:Uncharacterized protein n=1 Tax=Haloferax mucosum ATCC BAA-1512 TaxID=662479 RepID=M0I605_9EURY|nr:hypothetical protein [Haloferax mucosum]ELZ91448.1 hypothetical protein C440_14079 [Haloferax mucosum ATCC BAA-1512]
MPITALHRTVRRGFAVVIIQLSVMSAQLHDIQGSGETIATFITLPLFFAGAGYLVLSLVHQAFVPADTVDSREPPEKRDS